jgi:hypothetical protein
MAHTITWQRGDGKTFYQPATGDDRMWISDTQGLPWELHWWSPTGEKRPLSWAAGHDYPRTDAPPHLGETVEIGRRWRCLGLSTIRS